MHEHKFLPSAEFKDYEYCIGCGSYHSLVAKNPIELYESNYWDGGVHNTPFNQKINLEEIETCGISKADFIMQFVPRGEAALEAGCFPGVILDKLSKSGYSHVFGIEPNSDYIPFILENAQQSQILHGYFPEVTKELPPSQFDCIITVDTFEHIPDYEPFIDEVYRLLRRGGTAIIMSPIDCGEGFRERDMNVPEEHVWLFSKNFLDSYLKEKFHSVEWSKWIKGHELIILTK